MIVTSIYWSGLLNLSSPIMDVILSLAIRHCSKTFPLAQNPDYSLTLPVHTAKARTWRIAANASSSQPALVRQSRDLDGISFDREVRRDQRFDCTSTDTRLSCSLNTLHSWSNNTPDCRRRLDRHLSAARLDRFRIFGRCDQSAKIDDYLVLALCSFLPHG